MLLLQQLSSLTMDSKPIQRLTQIMRGRGAVKQTNCRLLSWKAEQPNEGRNSQEIKTIGIKAENIDL